MANKRGRKPGIKLPETHRDKIKNSNILSSLIMHAEGKKEMSSTQVTAALGLLKKCLPDLQSVDSNVKVSAGDGLEQLLADIAANGKRLSQ